MKDAYQDRYVPEPNSGCWLWTSYLNKSGYGQIRHGKTSSRAHRVIYEAHRGKIPDGLTLDHKCSVRCCVNPDHLEPVTIAENLRRSPRTIGSINKAKTHCDNGHEFTPENTRPCIRHGKVVGRTCRACNRDFQARLRDRKRV